MPPIPFQFWSFSNPDVPAEEEVSSRKRRRSRGRHAGITSGEEISYSPVQGREPNEELTATVIVLKGGELVFDRVVPVVLTQNSYQPLRSAFKLEDRDAEMLGRAGTEPSGGHEGYTDSGAWNWRWIWREGWRRSTVWISADELKLRGSETSGKRAVVFGGSPVYSNHWQHVSPLRSRPNGTKTKVDSIQKPLATFANACAPIENIEAWFEGHYPDSESRFGLAKHGGLKPAAKTPGVTLSGNDPERSDAEKEAGERGKKRYFEAAFSERIAPLWFDRIWAKGPPVQPLLSTSRNGGPPRNEREEASREDPLITVGVLPPQGKTAHAQVLYCEGLLVQKLESFCERVLQGEVPWRARNRNPQGEGLFAEGGSDGYMLDEIVDFSAGSGMESKKLEAPMEVYQPVSHGLLDVCRAAAVRTALSGPANFKGRKRLRKGGKEVYTTRSWEQEPVAELAELHLRRLLEETLDSNDREVAMVRVGFEALERLFGLEVEIKAFLDEGGEVSRKLAGLLKSQEHQLEYSSKWGDGRAVRSLDLIAALSTWFLFHLGRQVSQQKEQRLVGRLQWLADVARGVKGAAGLIETQIDSYARTRGMQRCLEGIFAKEPANGDVKA